MGIRFKCPQGHKINVKAFLAGKRAFCPECGAKVVVPFESETSPTLSAMPAAAPALGAVNGANGTATATRPAATSGLSAAPIAAAPVIEATPSPSIIPAAASPAPVSAQPTTPLASPSFNANLAAAAAIVSAPAIPASPIAPPTGPDPIAEAPHAVWYVRPRSGGQFGPAPGDIFRQWIAQRRVTADSLVWRDGWSDWRVAGEVLPQLSTRTASTFAGLPGAGLAPTPAAAAPAAATAPVTKFVRARRSKSSTIAWICILGVVAIALVGALIYILTRDA